MIALEKEIASVLKRVDKLKMMQKKEEMKHRPNEPRVIGMWKGKPVISIIDWDLIYSGNFRKALQYFPNGYVHLSNQRLNDPYAFAEFNVLEFEVWTEQYHALLEQKKDAVHGREQCGNCFLRSDFDPFGLRRIIVKAINEKESLGEESEARIADSGHAQRGNQMPPLDVNCKIEYPCKTINRHECPRKQKLQYDDAKLIQVGGKVRLIEEALSFASRLKENQYSYRYEVDFASNIVKAFGYEPSEGTIEDLPETRHTVLYHVRDIFSALTNPNILEEVLNQYFSEEHPELNHRHVRQDLIEFMKTYTDKLNIKDLLDGDGGNIDDVEEELVRLKRKQERFAWPCAKCESCSSPLCHMKCKNCDVYTCNKHWYGHVETKHPIVARILSRTY